MLEAKRIARVRAHERAELADQVHDSVLQTLALIQRRADDPAAVTALARRQERDLRDWLPERTSTVNSDSLASSLRGDRGRGRGFGWSRDRGRQRRRRARITGSLAAVGRIGPRRRRRIV